MTFPTRQRAGEDRPAAIMRSRRAANSRALVGRKMRAAAPTSRAARRGPAVRRWGPVARQVPEEKPPMVARVTQEALGVAPTAAAATPPATPRFQAPAAAKPRR